jgi:hypothetical protein
VHQKFEVSHNRYLHQMCDFTCEVVHLLLLMTCIRCGHVHVANASQCSPNPIYVRCQRKSKCRDMDEMCTSQSALYSWGVFVGAASVIGRAAAAAAISCKYISKYQWELSVAVVALHYARQPLESSSEPVHPAAHSVCNSMPSCTMRSDRHMDEPSRPTNGTGPPKLGLLSRIRVVRAAYLSNCVRPLHNSRRAGTKAPAARAQSTVLCHDERIEELDH